MNSDQFTQSIIAQNGNDDCYSANGYVAIEDKGKVSLFQYGHCSCYGTWEDIADYESDVPDITDKAFWTGTVEEFKVMATQALDPHMPGRKTDRQDCDYDQLMDIYRQTLTHYQGTPLKMPKDVPWKMVVTNPCTGEVLFESEGVIKGHYEGDTINFAPKLTV